MDDEVACKDFEHQSSEETTVVDVSAPVVDNMSVASGHINTCIESGNVTNLGTSLVTQPTSEDMDTTSLTTSSDCNFLRNSQDPVEESTSNNNASQIQTDPETKQDCVTIVSSEAVLSTTESNTTDSLTIKESFATNCKDTLAEHTAEQENLQKVSTEDMEVTATLPVSTDHSKMVSQPAVASARNLEFLQKSEGLSSITQYRGDSSDGFSSDRYVPQIVRPAEEGEKE